ncbi:TetR/AcrR family transcriptional regulator [Vibrio sp. PP-XX7]
MIDFKNEKENCSSVNKPLTKKQESIASRKDELIQLAKSIVEEQGFTYLTMDRLTALSNYSKGTIYNHFCSKEDVILALCIHGIEQEARMIYRGANFHGSTREKMVAVHVAYRIFVLLNPELTACVLMANTPWITEKAAVEHVKVFNQLETQVVGFVSQIVTEAIEKGELTVTAEMDVESIVFSNWSMAFGFNALVAKYGMRSEYRTTNRYVSLIVK